MLTHLRTALHTLRVIVSGANPDELAEMRASLDYWRTKSERLGLHLDDIRCDVADAGIAPDPNGDPELEPRAMVRRLIARRPTTVAPLAALRAYLDAVNGNPSREDYPEWNAIADEDRARLQAWGDRVSQAGMDAENEATEDAEEERDEARRTVAALTRLTEQQVAEIERLRGELANRGKPQPLTENEDRAVRFITVNPGALVMDTARVMALDSKKWEHESRRNDVSKWEIDGESKFVYKAFLKGHLRREPDGNTFRYWPLTNEDRADLATDMRETG